MTSFFWIIGSTIAISAISLIGIFFLSLNTKHLEKYLLYVLANTNNKETHDQISNLLLKLGISYNKQKKNAEILNIINKYPNIMAYNRSLYNKLLLLMQHSATDSVHKKELDLSDIENLLQEIRSGN